MSIAAKRQLGEQRLYWRVNQFMMPFYSLVPPQSKFPDLSGHAWVPMDDNHTLCIFFSYHPSEPLPARTRELFEEGHNGRETGHPSRHAFVKRDATVPYCRLLDQVHARERLSSSTIKARSTPGSPACRAFGFRTAPARAGSGRSSTGPRSISAPAIPASR